MAIELIIFDMDGLMLDTEKLYFQVFSEVFAQNGLDFDSEMHKKVIGTTIQKGMEILSNEYSDKQLIARIFPEIEKNFLQMVLNGNVPVKPGLFELFEEIEKKNIKKTVATSAGKKTAMHILESTGIINHLEKGVFGDMVKHGKPNPDIFLLSCEQFNASPKDCLVLEDSVMGVRAAISAGVPVICVPDYVEPDENLISQCLAKCVSLFDVIKYI